MSKAAVTSIGPARWATILGAVAAAVLLVSQSASAAVVTVSVVDGAFQPRTSRVRLADTVEWGFAVTNSAQHTSTDNSGLGLWDSGLRPPGSTFSFRFAVSGTFPYRCTLHAEMVGQIQVTPLAAPPSGPGTTRFLIRWATALPVGDTYTIQIKGPQDASFRAFRVGTTNVSASFLPNQGPGTYLFRSQLVGGAAASRFSPAKAIQVTP
jgi:plastocyanin